jgi:hypothetical protein
MRAIPRIYSGVRSLPHLLQGTGVVRANTRGAKVILVAPAPPSNVIVNQWQNSKKPGAIYVYQ